MAGDDLVKGGAGSSATDVFGTVSREVTTEEEPVRAKAEVQPPVAAAPEKAEPVATASSAGFTQLLRALNYDQVYHDRTKDLAKEVQAVPEASAAEKRAVPASSSQVTSFLPQGAPVLPIVPIAPVAPVMAAAPVVAPARGSGSFTQLFQQLGAEPAKEEVIDQPADAAPSSFTQTFAAPKAEAEAAAAWPGNEAAPAPASPGSFTQLFATVDAGATDGVEERTIAPSEGAVPAPARAVDAAPVAEEAVREAPVAAAPGSFTQMFQALGSPVAEPVRQEDRAVAAEGVAAPVQAGAPVPAPVPLVVPVSAPGSFTQMFQALGSPAAGEARTVPAPLAAEPERAVVPAPGLSTPGSFTQMFRTVSEEPGRTQEPTAGPGSFTQMLSGPSAPESAVSPPPHAYERPLPVDVGGRGDSGASQMFATYREPGAAPHERTTAERGPAFSPMAAALGSASPASSTPSSGGLTQLLRALDGPAQAPKPYAASSYPPAAPAAGPGSFTGVYGELGASGGSGPAPVAPVTSLQPATSSPAGAPTAAAGPSEFTRLINASALREAGLRGGGEAAPAAADPAAAPGGGGGGFAMPSGLAAVPHASLGGLGAPGASISGPAGMHGSVSAAGGGHASISGPRVPHVPGTPMVKLPQLPKAAGAPAGVQKYVPLLLILVIFLLLAILVAVVVLMKK